MAVPRCREFCRAPWSGTRDTGCGGGANLNLALNTPSWPPHPPRRTQRSQHGTQPTLLSTVCADDVIMSAPAAAPSLTDLKAAIPALQAFVDLSAVRAEPAGGNASTTVGAGTGAGAGAGAGTATAAAATPAAYASVAAFVADYPLQELFGFLSITSLTDAHVRIATRPCFT